MVFGLGFVEPLRERINALEENLHATVTTIRNNGWDDFLGGFGDKFKDPMARMSFKGDGLLSRRDLEDLYQFNGIAAAVIDVPADDATRRWVDVRAGENELPEVDEALAAIPVRDGIHGRRRGGQVAINRVLKLSRMTGGGYLIVSARDGRNPWEPLDETNLEAIEAVYIHHAFEVYPHDYDDTGQVRLYQLAPDASQAGHNQYTLVHASRVWPFPAVELTASRQVYRNGSGDPVLQRVVRELKHAGFTEEQAARTVARNNVSWFKTKDLKAQVSQDGGSKLRKRLRIMARARSTLGMTPLDATEDVGYLTASLSGISDLLDRYPHRVCASSRIPMTKLYGTSPGGLNATGESDVRNYYDMVDGSIIKLHVLPCVRWLTRLLMLCAQGPTGGQIPEGWTVMAKPLWEMSPKEKAEVEKLEADADAIYMDRGAKTPDQVAAARGFEPVEVNEDEEDLDDLDERERNNALAQQAGVVRLNAMIGDGGHLAVVLPLPKELHGQVPEVKAPHITMVYIANTAGRTALALELVQTVVAQAIGGFRARSAGMRHLVNPKGQTVFYEAIDFDAWEPYEMRELLVKTLISAGFGVTFPEHWLPHVTLAYADDPRATFYGGMGSVSWWCDKLQVWGLPEVVDLPLGQLT